MNIPNTEYLDIVNEQDEVIGRATREEIHTKKLPRRIVHILVFNDKNELGLQLRSQKAKWCPGHWSTSAGGHVQSGETYEQAANRECREELGFAASSEPLFYDLYQDNTGNKMFLKIFKIIHNGPFSIHDADVEKIEFFSLASIRKMINKETLFHPELIFLLKKHFNINA